MSLANLLKKGSLRGLATATPATTATDRQLITACVATVVTVAVADVPNKAANDPRTDTPDLDRWCWPHSSAMNTAEIDTFTQRVHHFTGRGVAELDAETLADKLVTRDRDSDDQRLCLECRHLQSSGDRWCCNEWKQSGLGVAGLSGALARQLQRCDSFKEATT